MPRAALLIVNGFDREGTWGPFNAQEAVDFPWIRLCLDQIERHTPASDYNVLVWDNSFLPEHRALLEERRAVSVFSDEQGRSLWHPGSLDRLVSKVPPETQLIVTLDTDSFPIRDGWLDELSDRLDAGAALAGVWRDEMSPWVEPYIHPCCLAVRPETLRELGGRFKEKVGAQDVGQGITNAARARGWHVSGLERSNVVDVHFLMGGVYGDLIYHHGAGSRRAKFWLSRDVKSDEPIRMALRDAAFDDLDGLLEILHGDAPADKALELGLEPISREIARPSGTSDRQTSEASTRIKTGMFLRRIHAEYEPRSYIEIGIRHGRSLAHSRTATVAIDPAYEITSLLQCDLRTFRETSDRFFARRDGLAHLPGERIDFAFIDGFHLFEFALRDFINIEPHTEWTSVIVVDDPLPKRRKQASRERRTRLWAGDVFKLEQILRRYRPDLLVLPLDTGHTGILLILGADRDNRVLSDRYDEIVEAFSHPDPQEVPRSVLTRESAFDAKSLPEDLWVRLQQMRDSGTSRESGWPDLQRAIEASIRPAQRIARKGGKRTKAERDRGKRNTPAKERRNHTIRHRLGRLRRRLGVSMEGSTGS